MLVGGEKGRERMIEKEEGHRGQKRTMTTPAKGYCVKFGTYHCLSHTSCVLSCSLFYCISGLCSDMCGIA